MTGLTVDAESIQLLTRHLRAAAAELTLDRALLSIPGGVFESAVASALAATNADLARQSDAVARFVSSLADAGDRAAEKIIEADASLAGPASAGAVTHTGGQ